MPPVIFERQAFFNPKRNPYFNHATIQCFIAYSRGVPAGTIAACVDHRLQEHEPGVGNIGFFEFIDDEDVAAALLDAACAFPPRPKGMTKVQGPYNFNSNHEFGLLIDGFDTDPMIANPHNRNYYGRIYEAIGMQQGHGLVCVLARQRRSGPRAHGEDQRPHPEALPWRSGSVNARHAPVR